MTTTLDTIKPEKAMTLAGSQRQSVTKYGDDRAIQMEIKALKTALPNMLNQSDTAIAALLIASKMSNLSPYRGEIYLVPKLGVTIASKIKQADAISAARKRGDVLDIGFEPFTPNHPLWNSLAESDLSDKDVAVLCTIKSSQAIHEHIKLRTAKIGELKALGCTRQEIEIILHDEYGEAPVYRAVGIVKASEDFGDTNKVREGKFVAFSRNDRARKRALTKCLNANGLAAPDQREYGGVPVGEDMEPANFEVSKVTAEQVQNQIDPEFAAAIAEDAQVITEQQHADNARKLGRTEGDFDLSEKTTEDERGKRDVTPDASTPVSEALLVAARLKDELMYSAEDIAALKAAWTTIYNIANAAGLKVPTLDKPKPIDLLKAILEVGNQLQ